MTRDVITGKPDDTVDEAMATMTSHRIRHLPVVNHSGLVGMISIGDLVKARLDETEYHKQQMENLVRKISGVDERGIARPVCKNARRGRFCAKEAPPAQGRGLSSNT